MEPQISRRVHPRSQNCLIVENRSNKETRGAFPLTNIFNLIKGEHTLSLSQRSRNNTQNFSFESGYLTGKNIKQFCPKEQKIENKSYFRNDDKFNEKRQKPLMEEKNDEKASKSEGKVYQKKKPGDDLTADRIFESCRQNESFLHLGR